MGRSRAFRVSTSGGEGQGKDGHNIHRSKGVGVRGERLEENGTEMAAQGLIAGTGAVEECAGKVDVEMVVDLLTRVVSSQISF